MPTYDREGGNVHGFDVVAYNDASEKGYRVKLPGKPYELTVYQEFGDGIWYDPHIRMSAWTDDPDEPETAPYPEEGKLFAVFLLGVVSSIFTDMLLRRDAPVGLSRFHSAYDASDAAG